MGKFYRGKALKNNTRLEIAKGILDAILYGAIAAILASGFLLFLTGCGSTGEAPEPSNFAEVIELEAGHESLWAGRQTCEQYALRLRPESSEYAYLNDEVVIAAQAWNAAMGYDLIEVRQAEQENPFIDAPESAILVTPGSDKVFGPQPNGATLLELALAMKDFGPCSCQVEIWSEAWSANIIAHAMGHCFGLDHSDLPQSLMYPNAERGNITVEMIDLILQNMGAK